MVGWSDERLRRVILKLGKLSERSADQDALLMFLLDASNRRKHDHDLPET
jgi:hypothetical protein